METGYLCECSGNNGCHLEFEHDADYLEALACSEDRDKQSILHPLCPNIKDFHIVEKTDCWVLVE